MLLRYSLIIQATQATPEDEGLTAVAAKIPPVPSEDEAQFADDYSAHKTENVWQLCGERGYVLIVHGGGTIVVAQTQYTDLNEEEVRRRYGNKE